MKQRTSYTTRTGVSVRRTMKLSKLFPLIGAYGLLVCCAKSMTLVEILDSDLISSILNNSGNFTDREEEIACERMVSELTPEEQEIAARTSHAYWLASLNDKHITTDARKRAAKKEARRHLVAENGNFDSAMTRLRATCHFRKVRKDADTKFRRRIWSLISKTFCAGKKAGYFTSLFCRKRQRVYCKQGRLSFTSSVGISASKRNDAPSHLGQPHRE